MIMTVIAIAIMFLKQQEPAQVHDIHRTLISIEFRFEYSEPTMTTNKAKLKLTHHHYIYK
jgi:hypothetical protein